MMASILELSFQEATEQQPTPHLPDVQIELLGLSYVVCNLTTTKHHPGIPLSLFPGLIMKGRVTAAVCLTAVLLYYPSAEGCGLSHIQSNLPLNEQEVEIPPRAGVVYVTADSH